ncbi:hypothetical protein ACGFMK_28560 [Amycolatopsis sp. NPDC049252]|uniref:hypothetical protein n=1 Tax=Amycolatopsis sp. NPDC049252 TaxID=3363933 RepID=UPI00371C5B2E
MTSLVVTAPALLSAVAGFGGGVLVLAVFTVLFGLRVAMTMLTLTRLWWPFLAVFLAPGLPPVGQAVTNAVPVSCSEVCQTRRASSSLRNGG